MSDSRLTVAQMAAEVLREIGVLLIAFGPLEYLFSDSTSLTARTIGAIVALGMALFITGMLIERIRRS